MACRKVRCGVTLHAFFFTINAEMPITYFSTANIPRTFGPKWLSYSASSWASVAKNRVTANCLKWPTLPHLTLLFSPLCWFYHPYLTSSTSTTSVIFKVQMGQMERLNLVIVLGKLLWKSVQEFYTPFLLNSFLEHVPILHICSFFLLPILVPRFPVYLFRQSGYYFSQGGALSFALSN